MNKLDMEVLKRLADKFTDYVHALDNNTLPINFVDGNGVLVREEGYKEKIFNRAQSILETDKWDESWIGSGDIKERIFKVFDISANLLNFNAKNEFKKHFERENNLIDSDTERIIYEIYRGNDDKHAFEHAIKEFGAKYPILAYLFFVKDKNKYLPASPANFDRCFAQMNVDFKMSYCCNWDNYCEFINLVNETKELLPQFLQISHELSLLDAHSFIWIVGEERFIDWKSDVPDINTPMRPKRKIRKSDGTISYQCGRCNHSFKQNERCPECGQLVKV